MYIVVVANIQCRGTQRHTARQPPRAAVAHAVCIHLATIDYSYTTPAVAFGYDRLSLLISITETADWYYYCTATESARHRVGFTALLPQLGRELPRLAVLLAEMLIQFLVEPHLVQLVP